jgi:N-acetylmuramoyl-L-alanine amidase
MAALNPESVRFLVVHCSASKPSVFVDASVINRWHVKRGFLKVGYHFVIRRDGVVEKGRELNEIGAHAEGFNTRSIGICLAGGLNEKTGRPENNFTLDQFAALAQLILRLRQEKFPDVQVLGHRDLYGDTNGDGVVNSQDWLKDCPCFDVRKWMKETNV